MPFKSKEDAFASIGRTTPLKALKLIRELAAKGFSPIQVIDEVLKKFPDIPKSRIESNYHKLKKADIKHESGEIIKKLSEQQLKIAGEKKLSVSDYKELRNQPENKKLTQEQFTKVLKDGNYKTPYNRSFNIKNVNYFDGQINFLNKIKL